MSPFIALIIALAKAAPAVERFLAGLMDAYTAYKLEQNAQDENAKNARDDALIDAAVGRLPKCPTCGAPDLRAGQHSVSGESSPVSRGSSGSA